MGESLECNHNQYTMTVSSSPHKLHHTGTCQYRMEVNTGGPTVYYEQWNLFTTGQSKPNEKVLTEKIIGSTLHIRDLV